MWFVLDRGMDFRPIVHRKNNLNFQPLTPVKEELPVFLWGEETLSGFHRPMETPAVDLKSLYKMSNQDLSWHQAMAALHGSLSLPEVARLRVLVHELQQSNRDFRTEDAEWTRSFGWHYNQDLQDVLDFVPQLPADFQNWASDKDLGQRELRPLLLIKNFPEFFPHLSALAVQNPPRGEGVQLLEMTVELLLMDVPIQTIQEIFEMEPFRAILEMRGLRYPQRAGKQALMEEKCKKLPWPKGTQLKWNFLRDQPSLELKLLLQSEAELRALAQSMLEIQERLTSEDRNPWAH